MRVLITGVTGMIGTHLAKSMLAGGHQVAGLSRATSAARFALHPQGWKHYLGDILDRGFLEKTWKDWQPEVVFHLAAQAYNGASWDAEQTTYAVNIKGSHNVLDVCRRFSPKARVIPACSSAEYGFVPEAMQPIKEDNTPLRPITPYGVSKAAMEMMARQFHLNYGMDIVLPRLFIHVGPNHPPATALQNFAMQLALIKRGRREPAMRVGNLESSRDFVDVRDGVRALGLLCETGKSGDVYNICCGVETSIRKSLEILIEISGLQVEIKTDPALFRPSDEKALLGDNAKLTALGWAPRITFRQTLEDIFSNWIERLG